jgi:Ca2+-binding EF-hand superfamily protein
MTPRLSNLGMPVVALALLSGSVLACPPGSQKKRGTDSAASVSDEVKSDRVVSQASKFRSMILEQFDANGNGRLDSKERIAANKALLGQGSGPALDALRKQALVEFDKNHNGKLEKTEIHKALSSVNAGLQTAQTGKSSKRPLTADERTASKQLEQQLSINGVTTTSGQIQTLQNLLASNGSTLTPAEMALIQSLLSQLMSQTSSTGTIAPLAATTGTGSTGTTSASTGTGMCSGSSGSSTGTTGSSGTSSSGTGTSTTSALRNANNQNTSGPILAGEGGGGFGGGGGGGGGGFGGFHGGFRGR